MNVKTLKYTKWVSLPLGVISGFLVVVLMAITVADVISRSSGGSAIPGVLEYSEILMVAVVFLALPAAQNRGFHIRTSLLTNILPPHVSRILIIAGSVVGILAIAALAWVSVGNTITSFTTGEYRFGLTKVEIWPARAFLAVGIIAYSVEYVRSAVQWTRPETSENTVLEQAGDQS
ncbi:TRAP transporter small permease [Enteractinococcus helveticum]|uniref:Tripartite ATP-independent periplasmic transporters DctQ component domain-containing protein n=1 Tax=Enteractinococcus helveticum TaxID=1837282 RepID=A0A1B7M2V4_9MICC|nr:TRAP transporter small permease [Enteractinococcus helveticum]OAV62859.1 hypothetical protein A6F49_04150 [Enteractinococcus helveticum]